MSDRQALLKAILAAPDDDLPRLVFADWLEENGTSDADAARAEFIRLGCLSKAKLKITSAETKWIDANWRRLLPSVIAAAPKRVKPQPARQGRFLRVLFYWKDEGRTRGSEMVFEFVRGFARRAEFTNGHGYERFWQAVATDEPLAYHRPEVRPDLHLDPQDGPYARVLPTTWGDEVYRRAIGFGAEDRRGKMYRGVARKASAKAFHPLVVADEHGLDLPQHRARAAVATAMTARARELVGLS
ncbi:MAG: TIGR02996 domain-containing protein [Gemmataceae bacterium]